MKLAVALPEVAASQHIKAANAAEATELGIKRQWQHLNLSIACSSDAQH